MSSSTPYNRGRNRSGFTLTELLIGITIIGLLVGFLAVAGTNAIGTAREFAVTSEIVQMEQAIENFRTKYGFYPPSFEQFSRETTAASRPVNIDAEIRQFLPFLQRVAPNHLETPAQLRNWWTSVGVNLDQRSSLVFWLSGLSHNRQYPLSDGFLDGAGGGLPLPGWDDGGNVERQVYFEFDSERLVEVFDGAGASLGAGVRGYRMEHGKQNGELLFVYRDAGSYIPRIFNDPATGVLNPIAYDRTDADILSIAYHFDPNLTFLPGLPSADSFVNPDSFQLICFGLDGDGGGPLQPAGSFSPAQLRGIVSQQSPKSADNLCNFAQGRFDKFLTDTDSAN